MNVSYDRAALAAIDDLLRDGRWETWLHPRLRERGFELYCRPHMVVEHDKDFDLGEFLSQRYHYSRSYAGMRNSTLGPKRLLYALGAPLLPPLLYCRIARNVFARRGYGRQFLLATPLVLAYTVTGRSERRSATSPAAATACSRCGRVKVGVDATSWMNRRGYGRFARNAVGRLVAARHGDAVHAVHRPGVGERGRAARHGQRVRRTGQQGAVGGGVRPVLPAARRRAPALARGVTRAARRHALPVRLHVFPVVGTPTVVGVHDLIADDFPELTFPSRAARALWRLKRAGAMRIARRLFTVSETSRQRSPSG